MNKIHYLLITSCILFSLVLVAYYSLSKKEIKEIDFADIEKRSMERSDVFIIELISIYFTRNLRENEIKKFAKRFKYVDFDVIAIRKNFIGNTTAIIASYNIDKSETDLSPIEKRLTNFSDHKLLEKITNNSLVERANFSGKRLVDPYDASPSFRKYEKEPEKFYNMHTAYEIGWLFWEELQSILYHIDGTNPANVENFTPIPKSPETLSEETLNQIKRIHVDTASELQKQYYKNRGIYWKDLIVTYYGTYGEFTAVSIDNHFRKILNPLIVDPAHNIDGIEVSTGKEPLVELIILK